MTSTAVAANTNTPCAACKAQRRKCTSDCVFAPYFPPDNPQRFNFVHKVFGASNVSKILMDLPPENREDAVNSMAYEAEARLRDPVYGCVGLISILQQRLRQLQSDVKCAKSDLSQYIGPSAAMLPFFPPLPPSFAPRPGQPLPPLPPVRPLGVLSDHLHPPPPPQHHPHPQYLHPHQQHQQQQQMITDEQYAAVAVAAAASLAREQEEIRIGLEQHKFHQQAMMMMRSSSSSPSLQPLVTNNNDGFIHNQNIFDSTDLALGTFGVASYHVNQQQQQQHYQTQEFNHQIQEQFMLQSRAPHPELQPQPQQQCQLRLGVLRKLEDEDESSLLGHNNNVDDDGPSTY